MKRLALRAILFGALSVWSLGAHTQTPSITGVSKNKADLEKTPKSLFLIKKIKISPAVGEPQFDPAEAQLGTIINDAALQNIKKFE